MYLFDDNCILVCNEELNRMELNRRVGNDIMPAFYCRVISTDGEFVSLSDEQMKDTHRIW